jgi:hypothetical protein
LRIARILHEAACDGVAAKRLAFPLVARLTTHGTEVAKPDGVATIASTSMSRWNQAEARIWKTHADVEFEAWTQKTQALLLHVCACPIHLPKLQVLGWPKRE